MKKILLTFTTFLAISTGAMATDLSPKHDTIRGGGCGFSCGGGH